MTDITLFPLIVALFVGTSSVSTAEDAVTKIACVGDSITYGSGIQDRSQTYPAQLQSMLGEGYEVKNFGRGGTTLLKNGRAPYSHVKECQAAKDYQPDLVIIMLGTNDTRPNNWAHADDFGSDYTELIKSFRELKSKPEVWICIPIPVFGEAWNINNKTLTEGVIPGVKKVADKTGVGLIDLYQPLAGKPELVPDKVHPKAAGAKIMAEVVRSAIIRK